MLTRKRTRVTGQSRMIFYVMVIGVPVVGVLLSAFYYMEGSPLSVAITHAAGKTYTMAPMVFSFSLAVFSYYILTLRAFNYNMKWALFHKERIIEYEIKILDSINGHLESSQIETIKFLLEQYDNAIAKIEGIGYFPGDEGEPEFYRNNQARIVSIVEGAIQDSSAYQEVFDDD